MRRRELLRYGAIGAVGLVIPRRRRKRRGVVVSTPGKVGWRGSDVNVTKLVVGWVPTFAEVQLLAGPRGPVGTVADPSSIPGYPGTFDATVTAGATTIQTAITAQPTGAKIRVQSGTYAITSEIQPKTGQELWFDSGAQITNGASLQYGIHPTGSDNCKIMNATVSGFSAANGAGINPFNCDGWEIAYCDVSGCYWNIAVTAGSGLASVGNHVHHNKSYNAGAGGVFAAQRITDDVWEDNEFGTSTTVGAPKFLGTTYCIVRHNYFHGIRAGTWYDTGTTSNVTEWNHITDCGNTSPMGAICYEICRWQEGTGTGNDTGTEIAGGTRNIVRYNYVHDNGAPGILIRSSAWVEAYGNVFYHNLNEVNSGANAGEIDLTMDGNLRDAANNSFDTKFNHIHHNQITPFGTRRAARIQISNVADTDPYLVTNTKNNNWDFNTYSNITTTQFAWPFGTNKTWAQWQAVAQGPSGTGSFQDINGELV